MNRNRLLFYLGILWGLFIILHAADGILWLKPMPFPFPYVWEALCGLLLMALLYGCLALSDLAHETTER